MRGLTGWLREHWAAWWRDFTGKDDPPPLPRRTRTTAPVPPHYPDGDPLDEWWQSRWDRIVRNEKTGRPR
ncbi:MAG TPA: hypothetical protein VGF32_21540 [Streptosporangiaceae bacterium]